MDKDWLKHSFINKKHLFLHMNKREYRKDVKVLAELYAPFEKEWQNGFKDIITNPKDQLNAGCAMGALKRDIPLLENMIEASGSIYRNYISTVLNDLVELEKIFLKYDKNYGNNICV